MSYGRITSAAFHHLVEGKQADPAPGFHRGNTLLIFLCGFWRMHRLSRIESENVITHRQFSALVYIVNEISLFQLRHCIKLIRPSILFSNFSSDGPKFGKKTQQLSLFLKHITRLVSSTKK